MLIVQCIDVEQKNDIINRTLRFLPASIKLQNATITQKDCLTYLENDTVKKLILLDVPYIGSKKECGIKDYNYKKFHKKVADLLYKAEYPFIYYCRSSAPKSDKSKSQEDKANIMKMKLGQYFLISNVQYSESQFQWNDFSQNLL